MLIKLLNFVLMIIIIIIIIPIRKTPSHDSIHGFWFKKLTSIHDRLAIKMNICLKETDVPEWMIKGKNILIQKDPLEGTTSKQLQAHNMHAYDVENTNEANKGEDL